MSLKCFNWAIALSLVWPFHGAIATAQIIPDSTLPVNSIVTPDGSTFTIDGGSIAGTNLFHSFEMFSVPANGEAVFNNPVAIENIFTRVTGNSISNIDGLLQTQGTANLFFLNPNGIVFGPDSRLEIGGSFIGTTAESVAFADGFQFSTSNPNETPLLTVSVPVGLQFGTSSGTIINRSRSVEDTGTIVGLQGNVGETLGLMGSDVRLEGGYLTAPGGAIALGSIASGEVSLNPSASGFNFDYTTVGNLGTIDLSGGAVIDSSADTSGAIDLRGSQINLTGESRIVAVTNSGDGGDVTIAGDRFFLGDRSAVIVATEGAGNGGNLSVTTSEAIDLVGTGEPLRFLNPSVFSEVTPLNFNSGLYTITFGSGTGGDLQIETQRLNIRDRMLAATFTTRQNGSGGSLLVRASNSIDINGGTPDGISLFNQTELSQEDLENIPESFLNTSLAAASILGKGNGGDATIETENLNVRFSGTVAATTFLSSGSGGSLNIQATDSTFLEHRGLIFTATLGEGNAGDLILFTPELTLLENALVVSGTFATGNGGNLRVNSDKIFLDRRSQLTSSSLATRFGEGQAGSLTVNATESIFIQGESGLFSQARSNTNAGDLTVNTGRLHIETGDASRSARGGIVSSLSIGGNAGNIIINADGAIELIGNPDLEEIPENFTGFSSEVLIRLFGEATEFIAIATVALGAGDSGDLAINTPQLTIQDGAFIVTAAVGTATGGNLEINASQSIRLSGFAAILSGTIGEEDGGVVTINTEELALTEGAIISTDTLLVDNAISVLFDEVTSSELLRILGLDDLTTMNSIANGDAGNIEIFSDRVSISNGSRISTATGENSQGMGGILRVRANTIEVEGIASGIPSRLSANTEGAGNAGDLILTGDRITVLDGAEITVSGRSEGAAGTLNITADRLRLDNGNITADTITGNFGNINLQTGTLQLRNLSSITTNATGRGGNIVINTDTLAALENSDITANSLDSFGGRVSIEALAIVGTALRDNLTPQSDITATSDRGPEFSGTVILETPDVDFTSGVLETPRLEAIATLRNPCDRVAETGEYSQFINVGTGGNPPPPSDAIDLDLLPDSNSQFPEAQGWIVDESGVVSLTVDSTGVTPYSSQQTPVPECE